MKKIRYLSFQLKSLHFLALVMVLFTGFLVSCRIKRTPKDDSLEAVKILDKPSYLEEGEAFIIEHLSWSGSKRTATLTPHLKWSIHEYNSSGLEINHFLNDTLKLISSNGEKIKISNEITGYGILFYFFDPPDYKEWKSSNHMINFLSWDRKKWEATLKRRDPYVYRVNVPDYPFLLKKLK